MSKIHEHLKGKCNWCEKKLTNNIVHSYFEGFDLEFCSHKCHTDYIVENSKRRVQHVKSTPEERKTIILSEVDQFLFNANSYIKVKLTELGYQHLASMHNMLVSRFSSLEYHTTDYYKKQADEDGYCSFQLWEFMQCFGPNTGPGQGSLFDINIVIPSKYLKPQS